MTLIATDSAPTHESVCVALYRASQASLRLYQDLLAPWGLSFQQAMVLGVLWELGQATPGRLAAALLLDASSVSGLLARLERAGLVERETDAADRRRVTVRATTRSLEIRDELEWLPACVAQALALDAAQAHDLVGALDTLRLAMDSFARPAPADTTTRSAS